MPNDDHQQFLQDRRQYFEEAHVERFFWMTRNPYFSKKEKELLRPLNELHPARLLEIGCGEAGNLLNLEHRPPLLVGVDLFEQRCRFARRHCPAASFVCADGNHLPVPDGVFDVVFCRDVLHHVRDQAALVREMARACRRGGRVVCIEACGRNPVIALLAALIRAERGLFRSHPGALTRLLEGADLADVRADMFQPLPTYRIVLHPIYGFPILGRKKWYAAWADAWERLYARIIPRRWWAYAVVSGRKK